MYLQNEMSGKWLPAGIRRNAEHFIGGEKRKRRNSNKYPQLDEKVFQMMHHIFGEINEKYHTAKHAS